MEHKFLRHLFAAGLATLLSMPVTHAADYSAGASASVDTSHNDNIRLAQNNKTSVSKYDFSPSVTFGAATETTKLNLNSNFDFNRYDRSEFDSNDQTIALDLSHKLENGSINLDAAYINNSTVTSELLTSGKIGNKAERAEQYQLSPSWIYSINETNLLQLQASYLVQDYRSNAYHGYKSAVAGIDWVHMLSERAKLITAFSYSDYQSDDIKFNVPGRDLFVLSGIDSRIYSLYSGWLDQQSYSTESKVKNLQL
ncbi:MAG TPA: hypothetical protein VFM32_00400, partial [Spongiibacteraceae bacterium]|nr:hypothetical protein [Spongiibacteraceae bacterium]